MKSIKRMRQILLSVAIFMILTGATVIAEGSWIEGFMVYEPGDQGGAGEWVLVESNTYSLVDDKKVFGTTFSSHNGTITLTGTRAEYIDDKGQFHFVSATELPSRIAAKEPLEVRMTGRNYVNVINGQPDYLGYLSVSFFRGIYRDDNLKTNVNFWKSWWFFEEEETSDHVRYFRDDFPSGEKAGDRMTIEMHYSFIDDTVMAASVYEWQPVDSANQGIITQIEESMADPTAASNQETNLATAIIVGLAGLLIAIGTALGNTPGGNEDKKASEKDDQKTYSMSISKNFGDTITYDAPPQTIKAHILEHDKVGVRVRPDLSSQIQIFGVKPLKISPLGLTGDWQNASVGATSANGPTNRQQDCTISFRYEGEGGLFQNNMRFKLAGDPKIRLAETKINILASDSSPYEVLYELIGFYESDPEIIFSPESALVNIHVGVDDRKRPVLKITPSPDAETIWDHTKFIEALPLTMSAKNGDTMVEATFTINLCFEGIGTAFKNTPISAVPDDKPFLIPCGAKDPTQPEQAPYALPLTVMRWDSKARELKPDVMQVYNLTLEVRIKAGATLRVGAENYKKAENAIEEANITAKPPGQVREVNTEIQSAVLEVSGENSAAGANQKQVLAIFENPGQNDAPLMLTATIVDQQDYKEQIRWLLTYANGSYTEQYIKLGDVDKYWAGLDHISGVYLSDQVPFKSNKWSILSGKKNKCFYEDAYGFKDYFNIGDPMRMPYIALAALPGGIGDYLGITALYHELSHTLEDILLNERGQGEGCERRTYFLEDLAKVSKCLVDAERGLYIDANISSAIIQFYDTFEQSQIKPWVTDISALIPPLGAYCRYLPKAFFYHYATAYNGPNAETIRSVIRKIHIPALVNGKYREEESPFAGGIWNLYCKREIFKSLSFDLTGFKCEVTSFEWLPDKVNTKLQVKLDILPPDSSHYEQFTVIFESLTPYLFDNPFRVSHTAFSTTWNLMPPSEKGFFDMRREAPYFYGKTGGTPANSTAKRL